MSDKKQTAVEWLSEKLWNEFGIAFSNNILEQAKELEKRQIVDSWTVGWNDRGNDDEAFSRHDDGEDYYSQKYNQ